MAVSPAMIDLQRRFTEEAEKLKAGQKTLQKCIKDRQQVDSQLNENQMVKEELDRLDDSNNIYKLVGPVLIKQSLDDAKDTVANRVSYLSGQVKRHEATIKDLEKKQEEGREKMMKLQQTFQQAQSKAASANKAKNT